jgi:uncharacterized membrane protein (DUF4010 family)
VIYPALPRGSVGPWNLIEPRAAWVTVILIAGIGFVNYILWKLYGAKGTEISGFLGGLVNSNFTVIELSSRVKTATGQLVDTAYRGILLATTAMLARNATLLLILAPAALVSSLAAFALMFAASAVLVLLSYRGHKTQPPLAASELKLEAPFSLPVALKYGFVFLLLHVLGGVMQREFGELGFYFVSVVGGLMSSASAVAAAATLASHGDLSPTIAGRGALLASFTSIAFSLSFVWRSGNRLLLSRLAMGMVVVAVAGLAGTVLWKYVQPLLKPWH